jgi:dUTP pyrophosphatase
MKVKLLNEYAILPTRATEHSAGYDLYAPKYNEEELGPAPDGLNPAIKIDAGKRVLIKTGVACAIPKGCYGQIAPRSGLAYKFGLDILAGVIDADYRGDIGVILINHGDNAVFVQPEDRIAQFIIKPICEFPDGLVVVEDLDDTSRGGGGFGSTGQ